MRSWSAGKVVFSVPTLSEEVRAGFQNPTLMLIQSIHYVFAPEHANQAEEMLRELRDASRREEGVIAFDVGRSQEHPGVFALWEEYRDEAALEAHKTSEHFKRLALNGVRPLAQQRIAETVFPL